MVTKQVYVLLIVMIIILIGFILVTKLVTKIFGDFVLNLKIN